MIFSKDRSAGQDRSFQTIKTGHHKKKKNKQKKQRQKQKQQQQQVEPCFFMTGHLNRDKHM